MSDREKLLGFVQWVLDQYEIDTREAQDRAERVLNELEENDERRN